MFVVDELYEDKDSFCAIMLMNESKEPDSTKFHWGKDPRSSSDNVNELKILISLLRH